MIAWIEQVLDAAVDDVLFGMSAVFELSLDAAQTFAEPIHLGLLHLRAGLVRCHDVVPQLALQMGDAVILLAAGSRFARLGLQLSQFGCRLDRLSVELPEFQAEVANLFRRGFIGCSRLAGNQEVIGQADWIKRARHRLYDCSRMRNVPHLGGSIDGLEQRFEFGQALLVVIGD